MTRWLLGLCLLLLIPTTVFAQEAVPTVAPTQDEIVVHRVIAGQTLYTIANLYGVTVDDLLLLNNLTTESLLSIGQELVISGVVPLALGVEAVADEALLNLPNMPPVPKIHPVQAGDTLFALADRYGLSVDELKLVNGFSDETVLNLGMTVFIPNQTGDLFERNYIVDVGDTLESIAARFQTTPELVQMQSGLLNPDYLIAGQQLRLVSRTGTPEPVAVFGRNHTVQATDTLTTIAARYNQPPQAIARANQLVYPTTLVPGTQLRIPGDVPYQPLPASITRLALSEQPFRQGETISIYLETTGEQPPSGRIRFSGLNAASQPWFNVNYDQAIRFYPHASGYVALVGIGAFAEPGLYALELFVDDPTRPAFVQWVQISGVNFGFQSIGIADNESLRASEDALLEQIYSESSAEALWQLDAPFQPPLDNIALRSAGYGAPRSYAGAPVRIFHTGVDYAAPVNTPIKAVAAGTVVFSDFTELRGNVVVIDHGWGVMSAYFHMEQRAVVAGDAVAAGQVIGGLGNTGLSTGAHLHWDVRVSGVPVNGLQWLEAPLPNLP